MLLASAILCTPVFFWVKTQAKSDWIWTQVSVLGQAERVWTDFLSQQRQLQNDRTFWSLGVGLVCPVEPAVLGEQQGQ